MEFIRITGSNEKLLDINLKDILTNIKNGSHFNWCVLHIEGIGNNTKESIIEFENKVNKSENGLLINWNELTKLSEKFSQIINLLLIGDKDSTKLIRYQDFGLMYKECFYVIELVDSSYWEIRSKQD